MKNKDNYMVYVGHEGARYSEYKALCQEFDYPYHDAWWGDASHYGMERGCPTAADIDYVHKYNFEVMTLDEFERTISNKPPNVDNFSII